MALASSFIGPQMKRADFGLTATAIFAFFLKTTKLTKTYKTDKTYGKAQQLGTASHLATDPPSLEISNKCFALVISYDGQ